MNITRAKLIKKEYFTSEICEFTFSLATNIPWQVGQFAMISIEDEKEPLIKRAYSIASSPTKGPNITFLIKRVEEGRGTSWLFDDFHKGNATNISLAFGHMTLEENENEILLIGTGIGIAPMLSFIDYLEEKSFPQKTRLIFGCRHEEELVYLKKFKALSETYENFEFFPTVSRPQNWAGRTGRADKLLNEIDINFSQQNVYICGSPEVAKSLKAVVIQKGTLEENIKVEAF